MRSRVPTDPAPDMAFRQIIAEFFRSARKLNAPSGGSSLAGEADELEIADLPDHFLLIEPDTAIGSNHSRTR